MSGTSREKLAGYLSDEHIEEYRAIFRRQFGRDITKEEAYDQALYFIGFLKWLYRPIGQAEWEALQTMPEEQPKAEGGREGYRKVPWYHQAKRQEGASDV